MFSDEDVAAVRAEVAAGGSVTVWFTVAAVGVPVGGSARVLAVGDATEGDFIQVRPAGSRDTMSFSPNELTRTRPARRRSTPSAATARAASTPPEKARPAEKPRPTEKTAPAGKGAVRPARKDAEQVPPPAPGPAPARTPEPTRRRAERPGGISVTLTATVDGEWSVEVLAGTRRVVRATPVPTADVAAAARSLPPAVTEAIEASVAGARQRQRDKVEQLRAELDAAQKVLDRLGSAG